MNAMPERCALCDVRHLSICASMDDVELDSLSTIGRRRVVPAGQVVAWERDESVLCANLVEGVVKLSTSLADGREQIVGLLFPGDFVGQPFENEATVTVTALSDVDLCYYPRVRFEQVLDDHARLERALLQRVTAALNEARARMLTLGRRSAEERVAGFLVNMAERLGVAESDGAIAIELPLTRGEMAGLLGLTIETVSRQMTALKRAGLVELPNGRRVVVRDMASLQERAGAD